MGWGGKVIGGTVLVVTSFVIGVGVGDDPTPPPPPPVIKEVPKYITHDTVTEKKVVPKVCLDAIKATNTVSKSIATYEDAVGRLPALIDDTYQAIQNQDTKQLNDLKTQQVKLEADSLQALLDIRTAQERLDKLQPRCNDAIG